MVTQSELFVLYIRLTKFMLSRSHARDLREAVLLALVPAVAFVGVTVVVDVARSVARCVGAYIG